MRFDATTTGTQNRASSRLGPQKGRIFCSLVWQCPRIVIGETSVAFFRFPARRKFAASPRTVIKVKLQGWRGSCALQILCDRRTKDPCVRGQFSLKVLAG